ncbi:MAG: hypothetical protein IPL65_20940 [Lewinellaceae bacterium]|nr:hypothetical protein [Lewinellaceae bacterium]
MNWLSVMQQKQLGWLRCCSGVYPFQRVPEESFQEVWNHMLQDKKNQGGAVRMAIPGEKPFELQLVTISAQETEAALRWYNSLR